MNGLSAIFPPVQAEHFAVFQGFRLDKMSKIIPYIDNTVKMHYTGSIETDHEVLVYENNSIFAICNSTLLLLHEKVELL